MSVPTANAPADFASLLDFKFFSRYTRRLVKSHSQFGPMIRTFPLRRVPPTALLLARKYPQHLWRLQTSSLPNEFAAAITFPFRFLGLGGRSIMRRPVLADCIGSGLEIEATQRFHDVAVGTAAMVLCDVADVL
jgi:hypothetical protein